MLVTNTTSSDVYFGPLHLGTLAQGEIRDLSKAELGEILTIARNAKHQGSPDDSATAEMSPNGQEE